jgi:hypothetical protein
MERSTSDPVCAAQMDALVADVFASACPSRRILDDVQATIPPRVEYSLTPLGERVAGRLRDLIDLVEAELPAVRTAQERYDREKQQVPVRP